MKISTEFGFYSKSTCTEKGVVENAGSIGYVYPSWVGGGGGKHVGFRSIPSIPRERIYAGGGHVFSASDIAAAAGQLNADFLAKGTLLVVEYVSRIESMNLCFFLFCFLLSGT